MFHPFRRLFDRFRRRRPAMIGPPPSSRGVPLDPGLHALDFSKRYANPLDYHAAQTMLDLGLTTDQMGDSDREYGIRHATFHPHRNQGGTVTPSGRVILDSGVMNPDQLTPNHGPVTGELWAKSGLRARMQAIIAHELAEYESGSHEAALRLAPETRLPIGEAARRILRAMAR